MGGYFLFKVIIIFDRICIMVNDTGSVVFSIDIDVRNLYLEISSLGV